MTYADPEVQAAYNRERWRTHGAQYRVARAAPPPPISRSQVLAQDVIQAHEIERLEARHMGRQRAGKRFASWLKGELAWLAVGSSYVIEGKR